MTNKTFRGHVILTGSALRDEDLGEKLILIVNVIENGRAVDYRATFDHGGRTIIGLVEKIIPPDWEQNGVIPIVRVIRSLGS
jgi:hypothetical protein